MYNFTIKDTSSDEIILQKRAENYVVFDFEVMDNPIIIKARGNIGFDIFSLKDNSVMDDEDFDFDAEESELILSSDKNIELLNLNIGDVEREFEFRVEKEQPSELRNKITERLRNEASRQSSRNLPSSRQSSLPSSRQSSLPSSRQSSLPSSRQSLNSEALSTKKYPSAASSMSLKKSNLMEPPSTYPSVSESQRNSSRQNRFSTTQSSPMTMKRSMSPSQKFSPSRLNSNLNSIEIIENFKSKINRQVDSLLDLISNDNWANSTKEINEILLEIEVENSVLMRRYKEKLNEILEFENVPLSSPQTSSIRVSSRPITTDSSRLNSLSKQYGSSSSVKTQQLYAYEDDE
jgi:hypothetical protein